MHKPILRLLIQDKIADGRLPHDHMPRKLGGPGNGETCDGCGETVTSAQMMMEGLAATGSGVRFHVACFHAWNVERQMPGYEPSGPSGRRVARARAERAGPSADGFPSK